VAGAEQRARRDDAVAGLQVRQHGSVHRGHAGCRDATGFGAFQQRQTFLQHRHGRVAEAGVLVALLLALEGGFRLRGAAVHEARSEE
jgi:hypothetical protein